MNDLIKLIFDFFEFLIRGDLVGLISGAGGTSYGELLRKMQQEQARAYIEDAVNNMDPSSMSYFRVCEYSEELLSEKLLSRELTVRPPSWRNWGIVRYELYGNISFRDHKVLYDIKERECG